MNVRQFCKNFDIENTDIRRIRKRGECEDNIINVFPQFRKHVFHGFGNALTASAGQVLLSMPEDSRHAVLENYFSSSCMGFNKLRLCIDSSDFSPYMYCAVSDADDIRKGNLDLSEDERFIFPVLDEIMEIGNGDLEIIMAPWSPPAFMKDNGSRKHGGHLLEENYSLYASYLTQYVTKYKEKGYPVRFITSQNEPEAVQTWDSCVFSARDEYDFAVNYLMPELGKTGVGVVCFDHNKQDLIERLACAESSDPGLSVFAGIAFHDYMGDHFDVLSHVREKYSDKRLIMTEFCAEYSRGEKTQDSFRLYIHAFLNDIKHGADTVIDWNMILDADGGPNHVGNFCSAPCLYSSEKGLVPQGSYAALQALAHTIKPGSVVLATSSFDSSLETLACTNGDGGVNVIVPSYEDDLIVNVAVRDKVYELEIRKDCATVLSLGGDEI